MSDLTTATTDTTAAATDTTAKTDTAAPAAATTDAKTETAAATLEAPAVDPKMVVPETADGYQLPVPEGDDGAFAKTAAAWFHEAGIPPAQAEKLAAKWNEFAASQQKVTADAEAAKEAQAEATYKEQDAALRKEWGDKYDANIELGKRAYREFGFDQDLVDAMEAKVGPAKLFKLFARLGQKIGEDTALGVGNGNNASSGVSAAQKLYGQ